MMMDPSPVSAFVRECCELGTGPDCRQRPTVRLEDVDPGNNGHQPGAKITFGRSFVCGGAGVGPSRHPHGRRRVR